MGRLLGGRLRSSARATRAHEIMEEEQPKISKNHVHDLNGRYSHSNENQSHSTATATLTATASSSPSESDDILRIVEEIRRREHSNVNFSAGTPYNNRVQSSVSHTTSPSINVDGEAIPSFMIEVNTDGAGSRVTDRHEIDRTTSFLLHGSGPKNKSRYLHSESLQTNIVEDFDMVTYLSEDKSREDRLKPIPQTRVQTSDTASTCDSNSIQTKSTISSGKRSNKDKHQSTPAPPATVSTQPIRTGFFCTTLPWFSCSQSPSTAPSSTSSSPVPVSPELSSVPIIQTTTSSLASDIKAAAERQKEQERQQKEVKQLKQQQQQEQKRQQQQQRQQPVQQQQQQKQPQERRPVQKEKHSSRRFRRQPSDASSDTETGTYGQSTIGEGTYDSFSDDQSEDITLYALPSVRDGCVAVLEGFLYGTSDDDQNNYCNAIRRRSNSYDRRSHSRDRRHRSSHYQSSRRGGGGGRGGEGSRGGEGTHGRYRHSTSRSSRRYRYDDDDEDEDGTFFSDYEDSTLGGTYGTYSTGRRHRSNDSDESSLFREV